MPPLHLAAPGGRLAPSPASVGLVGAPVERPPGAFAIFGAVSTSDAVKKAQLAHRTAASTAPVKVKPRFNYKEGPPTPGRVQAFLDAIASGSEDKEACEYAGCSFNGIDRLRKRDRDFAAAYAEARSHRREVYRSEARRRAIDGWLEPVFYRGEQIGAKRVFSDRLLELLLKAEDPDNFGDRVVHEVLVTPMTGGDVQRALAAGRVEGAAEALEAVAKLFVEAKEREEAGELEAEYEVVDP